MVVETVENFFRCLRVLFFNIAPVFCYIILYIICRFLWWIFDKKQSHKSLRIFPIFSLGKVGAKWEVFKSTVFRIFDKSEKNVNFQQRKVFHRQSYQKLCGKIRPHKTSLSYFCHRLIIFCCWKLFCNFHISRMKWVINIVFNRLFKTYFCQ